VARAHVGSSAPTAVPAGSAAPPPHVGVRIPNESLASSFADASALAAADAAHEPAFTTYTPDFVDTLDYVLVSPGLGVRGVRAMPSAEEVLAGGAVGAPSALHPSDHFPLVAELTLRA
jgi:mRNA deadenylase 3'-5' endonuclease subunit Ccr4